ncbi:hypothetical protein ACSBR2_010619 [Camellia fascicularis]
MVQILMNEIHYVKPVATEAVQLTAKAHYSGKSKEEITAVKIQTAFRGYLSISVEYGHTTLFEVAVFLGRITALFQIAYIYTRKHWMIIKYLIPVKLSIGILPKFSLLEKYYLLEIRDGWNVIRGTSEDYILNL